MVAIAHRRHRVTIRPVEEQRLSASDARLAESMGNLDGVLHQVEKLIALASQDDVTLDICPSSGDFSVEMGSIKMALSGLQEHDGVDESSGA